MDNNTDKKIGRLITLPADITDIERTLPGKNCKRCGS